MRGRIDGVFEGVLRGWAWDPTQPGRRLALRLVVDGEEIAHLTADLPRGDLEQAGLGDGRHGLEIALPLLCQDGARHEIAIEAPWHDKLIRLDTLTAAIPKRRHMLRGRLEAPRSGRLRGWAWDQARPGVAVALELLHQGQVVARFLADRHRPDLAHGGIGQGRHGFELSLGGVAPPGTALELRCAPEFGDWTLGRLTMPADAGEAPPRPPQAFLDEARAAQTQQDATAALRLLEHGLRLHPGDFDLLVTRARILAGLQQWGAAETAARRAQALRPEHRTPRLLLARLTGTLGRHAEAAEHWRGITPQDSAWRERLQRRPGHLAALGRKAELMAELTLAARHSPEDPTLAQRLAEAAETLGATGTALHHLRRLTSLAPDDHAAAARLATLTLRLAGQEQDGLASPLANPSLREWDGPISGVVTGEARLAEGLVLRGRGLRFAAAAPRVAAPGELPGYGLRLSVTAGGGEADFALTPSRAGLRMALALEASAFPAPGMVVRLSLHRPGQPARLLLETRTEPRLRLLRFDLPPGPGGALRLWLAGPGEVVVHPPHALARLEAPRAAPEFEQPHLAGRLPLPAMGAAGQAPPAETTTPFTTIEIAPSAPPGTLRRVLEGTAAPFEGRIEPGAEALADPRLRVLPRQAAPAQGWVAQVGAPPEGGPGWLSALHRAAAATGRVRLPGVSLEWRAP